LSADTALTARASSDDHRIKRAHGSELCLPRCVTIDGLSHRPGEDAFFGDDNEQSEINGVDTLAQNPALPASLTLRFKEADRILEVVGIDVSAQRLNGFERDTIPRIDVGHFSFGYDDEWFLMNAVLPRIQTEVNSAPQEFGLKTSLTIAGNDLTLAQRAFAAPDLFDDADVRVRYVNNSQQPRQAD
jgi:hypothetical protein